MSYRGKHRATATAPRPQPQPNARMQALDKAFLDTSSIHHEKALRGKENLVSRTEANAPYDEYASLEDIQEQMHPGESTSRRNNKLRRAAAAALLAVGIFNPNTANTSAAHPQETVAAATADKAIQSGLDGMLNNLANYEAGQQAAANTSGHEHAAPIEQPDTPMANFPQPPQGDQTPRR